MHRERDQRQPRVLPAAAALLQPRGDGTKSSGVVGTLVIFSLRLRERSLIGNATTAGEPQQERRSHRYTPAIPARFSALFFGQMLF